jgi:hypothetical protein
MICSRVPGANGLAHVKGEFIVRRLYLVLSFVVPAVCAGCGGSNSQSASQAVNVAGKWAIIAQSIPNEGAMEEMTLAQSGSGISASSVSLVNFKAPQIVPDSLNVCGGTSSTVTGTVAGSSISFSQTETGPSGTLTLSGSATLSQDNQGFSGTFTVNGCGAQASGALTGTMIAPLSGTFSGELNGMQVSISATEDQLGNLNLSGSSSQGAFILTGSTIGGAFNVSGQINGTEVSLTGFEVTGPFLSGFSSLSLCIAPAPCIQSGGLALFDANTGAVFGGLNPS